MGKDSYWFKHDSTASRDIKMMHLKAIYGYFGIGVYWAVIEVLREQPNYKWEDTTTAIQILSKIIDCDMPKFSGFITDCKQIKLLITDGKFIFSNRLISDMEVWETKKKNGGKTKTKRNRSETGANEKHKNKKINKNILTNVNIPTEVEFLNYCKTIEGIIYPQYEFGFKAKYESWIANDWKDGNDSPIKIWKTKIKNTIPYLKPDTTKTATPPRPDYSSVHADPKPFM